MTVRVAVKNTERLNRKLKALAGQIPDEVKNALLSGALLVEGAAKRRVMRGPKTGRIYTRRGINHQASAEGESPATDHGRLASSIQHWIKDAGMRIEVGSRLIYASMLEFGTRHMGARPFLFPSLEENRRNIAALVAQAVNKVVRRASR